MQRRGPKLLEFLVFNSKSFVFRSVQSREKRIGCVVTILGRGAFLPCFMQVKM